MMYVNTSGVIVGFSLRVCHFIFRVKSRFPQYDVRKKVSKLVVFEVKLSVKCVI